MTFRRRGTTDVQRVTAPEPPPPVVETRSRWSAGVRGPPDDFDPINPS